MLTLSL